MKKIILVLISIFLLVGCSDTVNSPSRKVEDFLSKYQDLDNDVLTQLQVIVDNDNNMTNEQKKEYKGLMQKQYQNLSYKITDERTTEDSSEVDIEMEVFDYKTSADKSKKYYNAHKNEFITPDDKTGISKFTDYKIKKLKTVSDKVTYKLTFHLTNEDGKWTLDNLDEEDIKKFHGLY